GIIDGIELFDAEFFGYSPKEAEMIDPQHRILLELAFEALELTGYHSGRTNLRIGVFVGADSSHYLDYINYQDHSEKIIFQNNSRDFIASRISYKLDLKGLSLCINTACSSSLVAVVKACQSL